MDLTQRVLIVKLSAIGDCVLTLPALYRLRRRLPGAHIGWLVEDRCAAILEGHPQIDELIVVQRRSSNGFRAKLRMAAGLVRRLAEARYELCLDFQGLFKSAWAPRMARIPRRWGYADAREGAGLLYTDTADLPKPALHAVPRYLGLLARALGDDGEPPPAGPEEFGLPADAQAAEQVERFLAVEGLERFAVFNISAGKPANRWAPESFGRLALELERRHGLPVVLGGGQADAPLAVAAQAAAGGARTADACGRFDLRGLVELLRRAALVVSGDSGPMHIANALSRPLVALFGSSDPARTGPYLPGRTRLLQHAVDCGPCFKKRCPNPPERQLDCLARIEVEEVLQAVEELL